LEVPDQLSDLVKYLEELIVAPNWADLLKWRFQLMSRRLDFNEDFRNRQAKYGLNVKDEAQWMENDAAARWLRKNENDASRKANHRPPHQQVRSSAKKLRRRKTFGYLIIDPCGRLTNWRDSI
jgi:hypothetical protein